MKTAQRSLRSLRNDGFSMVEMIGVLAIIAILAVVIVPKVFATIGSARVTSTASSINSYKSAVTDFASKYGTLPTANGRGRFDDLLITSGLSESRFISKLGTPASNTQGAVWAQNAAGVWANNNANNDQSAQSAIICLVSNANPPNTANGANYSLNGTPNLPTSSRVVSARIMQVPVADARELSARIDGDTQSQPIGSVNPDAVGRVVYAAPNATTGLTNVYVYIAHQ